MIVVSRIGFRGVDPPVAVEVILVAERTPALSRHHPGRRQIELGNLRCQPRINAAGHMVRRCLQKLPLVDGAVVVGVIAVQRI